MPFSLTAEALDECELSFVQKEKALQLMRDRPDLCLHAASQLADEVTALGQWLAIHDVSAQAPCEGLPS